MAEISKILKIKEKINKPKSQFLEIIRADKLLVKKIRNKKRIHELLISGMREVTTDATHTKSIISEYYEQFYANKFKN